MKKTRVERKNRIFSPVSGITIKEIARIGLKADEQVTFLTASRKEYDVVAKSWGFYATPSINHRLKKQGFKTALVKNDSGRFFVMLVEREKVKVFRQYLKKENQKLLEWFDDRA